MKNKLIIFDFDGVIIDSWEHAYLGNVKNWPTITPEQHRNFFNGNIHEEIAKLPTGVQSKEENEKWWNEVHSVTKKHLPVFDQIPRVVKELSEKYTLVINTSSDKQSTENYLKNNDMDFFETVYGIEVSKNKIEKFNQILKDFNTKTDDCIFVTDTVGDVLDAEKLSIPTLLVTYGYQQMGHFDSIKDKVIGLADRPADILEILNTYKS